MRPGGGESSLDFHLPAAPDEARALACVADEARWELSPRDAWRDGHMWTAFAPAVEGVLGHGRTRRAAMAALDASLADVATVLRGGRPTRTPAQQAWVDATVILARASETFDSDWASTARALAVACAVTASWANVPLRDLRRLYASARRELRADARRGRRNTRAEQR